MLFFTTAYVYFKLWQEIEIIAGNFLHLPITGKLCSWATGKVAEFPFNHALGN